MPNFFFGMVFCCIALGWRLRDAAGPLPKLARVVVGAKAFLLTLLLLLPLLFGMVALGAVPRLSVFSTECHVDSKWRASSRDVGPSAKPPPPLLLLLPVPLFTSTPPPE